jgi:pimeloyl-ACP methyl ester carboxylesterase
LAKVDLVGHSMGAMVAYLLAQRAPEHVRCLVLAEPPPPLPASPPRHEGDRPAGELTYDWRFQAPFSRQRNRPEPSWWTQLSAITAPTLILAGRNGSYPIDGMTAMADRIPNCRLLFLDAGHQIHEDQPAEFIAALRNFLETESPPP